MAAKKKSASQLKTARSEYPARRFKDAKALDTWLAKHHATSDGVRLELAKVGSGIASVTSKQAVDVALTWGWIDGKGKSFDETWWHLQLTPRRPKSIWSKVNCAKVEAFTAEGRMHPAGLAAVAAAKADGRWDAAYEPASRIQVPEDLAAELAKRPKAATFFESLDSQNRYAILFRLHTAKTPETRARRLATVVERLVAGLKTYP